MVVEVPLESVSLDSSPSQVRLASRFLRQVAGEEILFSPLLAFSVELVELVLQAHLLVAVPADVHQAPSVVEKVPWALVSLGTCFFLLHRQEVEFRLEAVLLAFLHQAVACQSPVVPNPEVVESAGWDHCNPD